MRPENKKIFLGIYYGGLLTGIFFMNYAFGAYPDIVRDLMEQFMNLDKFQMVSREEFFFYVLFMRGKQLGFFLLCYLFFPKGLLLMVLNFYFSFCLGGLLSLQSYYEGFQGIIYGGCYFMPHFISYGIIYYLALHQSGLYDKKLFLNDKKAFFCVILLGAAGCIMEAYVNSWMMTVLYGSN